MLTVTPPPFPVCSRGVIEKRKGASAMDTPLAVAYRMQAPAEVQFSGTVSSPERFFYGRNTRQEHEAFDVATASGRVEIVNNVVIGQPVPVHPGDTIGVRGEMVHDPGRLPCVHFVHHDPEHTHTDGYLRVDGKTYA